MRAMTLSSLFFLVLLAACTPGSGGTSIPAAPPADKPATTHTQVLRVAFSRLADPWIWTESEGARLLTDSVNVLEVILSSDGQMVVFKRDDTGELIAIPAEGGEPQVLVSADYLAGQAAEVWRFDFIPNTHQVLFTLNLAGGFQPFYDLQQADADAPGSAPVQVFAPGQGGIATFSPDGQWMSLFHPGSLDLAQVDGTQARSVFIYPEGYEPATFGPEIVWLADSSGFSLFHILDPMGNLYLGGLWFVPVAGEPREQVAVANTWGLPSPDGQRLGFTSSEGLGEVRIVDLSGELMSFTALEQGMFVGWAPDSERFLVNVEEEWDGALMTVTYLCQLGAEPFPLADTGTAQPIVWIDAEEFLFAAWGEIRLQSIGGTSLLLADQAYNLFDYAWLAP